MRSRFQIKRPSKRTMIIGTVVLGSLIIYGLTRINYQCDWTGFGDCDFVKGSSDEDYRPEKTLWDWMSLLIVPAALAVGGLLYNYFDKQNEQRRTSDNIQENVLASYLERVSGLLLDHQLRDSEQSSAVRDVAQGWTVMVLPRLSGNRKGVILQFLHGANLLHKDNAVIHLGEADLSGTIIHAWLEDIYLNGANLTGADMSGCYLWGADLSATDMEEANLENANLGEVNFENAWLDKANLRTFSISGNLRGARLRGADLTGTDLTNVDLEGANLQGAIVTPEQLAQANSLKNAIMPDGSKHE